MSNTLEETVRAIEAASMREATRGAKHFLRARLPESHSALCEVGVRLCAARHCCPPRLQRKTVLAIAADHIAPPSSQQSAESPAMNGMRGAAKDRSPLRATAQSQGANLVLVDVGIRGVRNAPSAPEVLSFRCFDDEQGPGGNKIMTLLQVRTGIQTGVALVFSLMDAGLDLLALEQVHNGNHDGHVSMLEDLLEAAPTALGRGSSIVEASEFIASPGCAETAVLAGVILGASSQRIPIVLASLGTLPAALIAQRIAPLCSDYLFCGEASCQSVELSAARALALSPILRAQDNEDIRPFEATRSMSVLAAAARTLTEIMPA